MRPDDPEVRAILQHSRVARLATLTPKGRPSMTPLWFVYDGTRLHFATGKDTVAARNVAAHPDVVVLLDSEGRGRHDNVLRLHGRATVHTGTPSPSLLARFGRKYYLAGWRSELSHLTRWRLRIRYYAQHEGATITVEPGDAELLRLP